MTSSASLSSSTQKKTFKRRNTSSIRTWREECALEEVYELSKRWKEFNKKMRAGGTGGVDFR